MDGNIIHVRIPMKKLRETDGSMSFADPAFAKAVLSALPPGKRHCSYRITKRSFDFRSGREPAVELCLEADDSGSGGNRNLPRIPNNHGKSCKSEKIVSRVDPATAELSAAAESSAAAGSPATAPFSASRAGGKPRPVVAGFGPAGIFCALLLARAGLSPVVLERGDPVESRARATDLFWKGGAPDPESNVQFGEGGAGAFSDGKLTTLVRDRNTAGRRVLETFCEFGAPAGILIDAHPHLGTDVIRNVVKNMRLEIIRLGGEIRFRTKLSGIERENGRIAAAICVSGGAATVIPADAVFLATGHSARDTFEMLFNEKIALERKPSAVGFRAEHPQELINRRQYGDYSGLLAAHFPASYKLAHHFADGRSAFTFCMCPGGYVINAASEPGGLVTNGMSYGKRDGTNANSAVLSGVGPDDYTEWERFPGDPLAGIYFQRDTERKAFALTGGSGKLPSQTAEEFALSAAARYGCSGGLPASGNTLGISGLFDGFGSALKGASAEADLTSLYSPGIIRAILGGIVEFNEKIPGFANAKAILTGPETRSSSPVRVIRDPDTMECISVRGLYPLGEGAGYAGGITSAAIDGIKGAEAYVRLIK